MASNGATSTMESQNMSPAEALKAKHAAASHNPTLEEVVDEEDILHPPPGPHHDDAEPAPMSDVAKGKQKAPTSKPAASLNVNSEEAFPSLGPAKPSQPAPSQTWSKKPIPSTNGGAKNTTNGPTQRPSAPASARATGAPVPALAGHTPSSMVSLPGRAVERISFAPHQITPRAQLKKSVPEVLREINKKSKATVAVREGPGGQIIFEGSGPQDAVRQALKDVANQVGSKQSIKLAVPNSVRPFLIGKQGQTIQGITKRSGARIHIPKQDEVVQNDDEDATIDITVEGDAVSAEMARREIQKIINERASTSSMNLKDIPPELYPFLAGQNFSQNRDLNLHIPTYNTWRNAPPPQADSPGQPVQFLAQPNLPIKISGDRQAAQEVREQIDREAQKLRGELTSQTVPIERGRHQFIVGQNSLQELFEKTGCSVIVPPAHDDSENIHVIGRPDQIENAINEVMDIAASMAVSNVDVSRQHARAPPHHAHNVARYLRERQMINELENQYNANFVLPASRNAPANWQIFSQDGKQGMRARTDAMNLIAGHPPSRFHSMNVNPFYHGHLRTQAPNIRRDHGVHMLFPQDEPDSPEIIIVYERPGSPADYQFPRQAPNQAEIQEHQKAIQAAVKHLLGIAGNDQDVVSKHVEAPSKFHDKVQRFVDREHRALPDSQIPPQLLFGRQAQQGPAPGFLIRGPSQDVDALNTKILAFLEQEKQDELERGFTMSFEYPHKFASHLIGRKGDNIKKLQDEFDVEINYTEGKVALKGPKAKCESCKSHILSMARKLEDEATHQVKIPAQYHPELKGPKGVQVMRLQDRYNVRINFPRQAVAPTDDGDAATESSFRAQPSQAPDVVVIKGPRRGADEAREELLNLLQYVTDHSHTGTVSVAAEQVPSLIGAGGRELDTLRNETQCRIDMPRKEDVDSSGRVEIKLKGTKKQVEEAKKILLSRAKTFDDTVTELLEVNPKHYKSIIGPSGTTLHKIVLDAGGPEDRQERNRMIQFPKQGSPETAIRIQGQKEVVKRIAEAIQAIVTQKEGEKTETMEIPPEKHRHLIGPQGAIRRKMEDDFQVEIAVPRTGISGPERSMVKITGQPKDVAAAMAHIESLMKERATHSMDIPVHLHHIVSDDGAIFRRLKNDHGITVDHAGKKPPMKAAMAGASRSGQNGGPMPLITDSPSDAPYSWELLEPQAVSSEDQTTIPWILRGNEDKLEKGKAMVEKALEKALANASKPSCTGYLTLADPKTYRFVIGPGGSSINSIRHKTGVQIQVPKQGSDMDAIEIKGAKEGVLKAKDLVLEAVENGKNNGGGRRQ